MEADLAGREEDRSQLLWGAAQDPAIWTNSRRCAITRKEDIRDLFVPKFFFGCEGDDRMTAVAFEPRKNPFGARLGAIYGSDMGHFDLPDMRDAAAEAWEQVEHGMYHRRGLPRLCLHQSGAGEGRGEPRFLQGDGGGGRGQIGACGAAGSLKSRPRQATSMPKAGSCFTTWSAVMGGRP